MISYLPTLHRIFGTLRLLVMLKLKTNCLRYLRVMSN